MLLVRLRICVDRLKHKAYKLLENSDADLSWLLFFKEPNLFLQHLLPTSEYNCHLKSERHHELGMHVCCNITEYSEQEQ